MPESVRTTKLRERSVGAAKPTPPKPPPLTKRYAGRAEYSPHRVEQFEDLADAQAFVDAATKAGVEATVFELHGTWARRVIDNLGELKGTGG